MQSVAVQWFRCLYDFTIAFRLKFQLNWTPCHEMWPCACLVFLHFTMENAEKSTLFEYRMTYTNTKRATAKI